MQTQSSVNAISPNSTFQGELVKTCFRLGITALHGWAFFLTWDILSHLVSTWPFYFIVLWQTCFKGCGLLVLRPKNWKVINKSRRCWSKLQMSNLSTFAFRDIQTLQFKKYFPTLCISLKMVVIWLQSMWPYFKVGVLSAWPGKWADFRSLVWDNENFGNHCVYVRWWKLFCYSIWWKHISFWNNVISRRLNSQIVCQNLLPVISTEYT